MDDAVTEIDFFSIYPDARLPTPASDTLLGSMPLKAAQYCLPLKDACGAGYYVYPPVDFAISYNGRTTKISWLDDHGEPDRWISLEGGTAPRLPNVSSIFVDVDEKRLQDLAAAMPPEGPGFINANPKVLSEVEITTGLIARTPPGWAVQVTDLVNWPSHRPFEVLSGTVRTSWFRGYIPTILRFREAGEARFFRRHPMCQLQIVPEQDILPSQSQGGAQCGGLAGWPDDIWKQFLISRTPRHEHAHPGTYQKAARRAERADRTNG